MKTTGLQDHRTTDYGLRTTDCGLRGARPSPVVQRAFSLIEILVTVALLSFIIVGLLAMFTQVQRAFRGSMKQTDVLEAGRAVIDMLARELAEMTPSQGLNTRNFSAEIPPPPAPPLNLPFAEVSPSVEGPLYQALPGQPSPGASGLRTNIIQKVFFLTQENLVWRGTGYEVLADYANAGIGTLYRFATNRTKYDASLAVGDFANAHPTNLSRIADGIVHFRVRAFATNGFPVTPCFATNACFRTNVNFLTGVVLKSTAAYWDPDPVIQDQPKYYFLSNAVPAYLELELGILEPQVLERYRGIGAANPAAQRAYLSNHVASVHLFRQRIPIRNVDFSAY
jgi:type II secretory pathway pseudopilin PulG